MTVVKHKLKATLKQAYKDGYLPSDLNGKIQPIKQAETQRNFLTIEELNILVKTECNNPLLKRAAIFSALTGLRFSDIKNLVWGPRARLTIFHRNPANPLESYESIIMRGIMRIHWNLKNPLE